MSEYDLIVIGGGPAGYNSAEYAAKHGLKTLLIEKEKLGGTCLNAGCIPTKTFLYASKLYHYAKDVSSGFGVHCENPSISHSQVLAKKNKVVDALVKGVEGRLKKCKVAVKKGSATLKREGDAIVVVTETDRFLGKNIIIATGSSPIIPPIDGVAEWFEKGFVLSSDHLLNIETPPERLVIVGGGVIGFEMAAYFQEVGSKVTVVEMMDKVLGESDREISALLQKQLERKGVAFHLNSRVTKVEEGQITYVENGASHSVPCDKILMAVGRKANISGIGLEETGVAVEKGVILTDERCRTNAANVYAIGDVSGRITLAHVGYREGEAAVNQILGRDDAVDYSAVSSIVYTSPEAAFVGLSEEQAKDEGIEIEVKKASINSSGRHLLEQGASRGVCKIIVDKKKQIILGAAIMSAYASEFIYAVALMIQNKIPVSSIQKTIFPHPTVCEIIRETLLD